MQLGLKTVFVIFCVALMALACSPTKVAELHLSGPTMGTVYNVKFVPKDNIDGTKLQAEIDQLLVDINQLMSTYIKDSELSQFNQNNSTEPFPMSDETLIVIKEALRLGKLSDGLLDVTVGPLVNLWGFGPQLRPDKTPSETQIAEAQSQTGLDSLKVGDTWISKSNPDLYVDLSTIAKGYAVDKVADLLSSYDIDNYLVEIGGEMRLSGVKSSGIPWRVAIEKPETDQRTVQKIISIGHHAIATSGDYRNYYQENGVRYSHIINPKTGYPIKHNLVSVTVVHASSMTADGLATALNVMGRDKALALAETNNLAVLLITKEKDGFKEYTSDQFEQLVTVH